MRDGKGMVLVDYSTIAPISSIKTDNPIKRKAKELKMLHDKIMSAMRLYQLKLKNSKHPNAKYLYKLLSNGIEVLQEHRDGIDAEYIKARLKLPRYKRAPKHFIKSFEAFFYYKNPNPQITKIIGMLFKLEEYYAFM